MQSAACVVCGASAHRVDSLPPRLYNRFVISPLSPATGLLVGIAFAVVLIGSGLIVCRALNLHRANPPMDWIEYGFVALILGLAVALWLGLILASLGWFSIERLIAAQVAVSLLAGLAARRRGPANLARPHRAEAALLVLLAGCAVVYFRPHEQVLGAADAGVYVSMGAHIARTGSLLVHDEEIARLDPQVYAALFREQPPDSGARFYQFPGFYLSDSQPGLIIPQFFALQAVSIAIPTAIGGVRAGLYTTPVWGVLGVASVYFFTRGLFGRRAALLGAAALAITATQIWFARYSTAEVLTQALLFAGLYALTRALSRQTQTAGWGVAAGLWMGLVFLARIDMVLVSVALVAALVGLAAARQWHSGLTAFVLTFGLLSLHSVIHAVVLAWPYTWSIYRAVFLIFVGDRWPALVLAGAMALIGAAAGVRWLTRLAPERRARLARSSRIGLVALVIVAAVYAYFIRPQLEASQTFVNWYDGSSITLTNQENLVRIGWYVTPLGLAIALAGLCALLWRERSAPVSLFLAIGLLSTVVYVINILNNPHQIYAARRYVPVVIPAIAIWGAYALAALSRTRDRRVAAIVAVVALGWLGSIAWQARVSGRQIDNAGMLDALASLDRALTPNAVVLMDDQSAVGLGDVFGTPLYYLFGHQVFVLRAPESLPPGWLAGAIEAWRREGRTVYLVGDAAKEVSVSKSVSVRREGDWTIETTMLQPTYTRFPDQVVPVRYNVALYTVE